MATRTKLKIDWDWVRDEVKKKERVSSASKGLITSAMNERIEKAKFFADPKIVSAKKDVLSIKSDSIEIYGGEILRGKKLSHYLNGSQELHIFLVTIGKVLEDKASLLMKKGDYLGGYLLDRIGSLAVESLAKNFEEDLRKNYEAKNMSVSMRISPGYCDWPIEEQFNLAKTIDFSKAGVRLTRSCMMVPRKSITAIVGIGPKRLFSKTKSQCGICDKKDCDYRRAP